MKKSLYAAVAVFGMCGIYEMSEGMFTSNPIVAHSENDTLQTMYLPLGTKPFERHNHTLWKTITELEKPLSSKSGAEYYGALVESAKSISSPDMKFAVLIETGNLAAINGYVTAFQEARLTLSTIVTSMDPNVALIGLKNQMLSYCFIEKNEYIPNHMECWNNRGSLALLVHLASNISGGEKALRKDAALACRILLSKLKEFEKP